MTALSERLVTRLASIGGRSSSSRRGFLAAATLGGTALALDPWGYVTRPQSAYAAVCGPGASCDDGWSAMCCSINGGHNTCPPNTYAGGWWKADRSSYCGGAARYYIDCNALPGAHFDCHCNSTNCDHRLVACNVFRYGQCNTQIKGTTAVVCRQISCSPPWEVHAACGHTAATDNNTAEHTAPCLTHDNTFPREHRFPNAASTLAAGHTLHAGDRLSAPDRHTSVTFTDVGNLVLLGSAGVLWTSGTAHEAAGGHALLRRNSELVVVDRSGRVRWTSRVTAPSDATPPELHVRDGSLAVVQGRRTLWHAPHGSG